MKKIKVAIGSRNIVKIQAVKKAFQSVWPDKNFKFISVEVNSRVNSQPMSDQESIRGAKNRAKEAIEKTNAYFGAGLEGGICQIENQYFVRAWIVIVDQRGNLGMSSTLSAPLSRKFLKLINNGKELGEVTDIISQQKDTKYKQGYFGFISDDLITREKAYIDGVIVALAKFKKFDVFS